MSGEFLSPRRRPSMKSRRFSIALAFALSLSLVYALLLSSFMKTGPAAPAPTESTGLKGKAVVVQADDKFSVPLRQAKVCQLGDRFFLVGKGCDDGDPTNWTKDRMIWVPMNRIIQIVEFESEEAMKKTWERYQEMGNRKGDSEEEKGTERRLKEENGLGGERKREKK
jgi:hypothetical protein